MNLGDTRDPSWTILFVDYPYVIYNRIYTSLQNENACDENVMRVLLSGQPLSTHSHMPLDMTRWFDMESTICSTQNESQRTAIFDVLIDDSPIKIIHGPPGTGKTSTLVPIIIGFAMAGKRVHVAAPTNYAICELARRYVAAISKDPIPGVVLSSALLIGNETRLHLDDTLLDIFLDVRKKKLQLSTELWPGLMGSLRRSVEDKAALLDIAAEGCDVKDINALVLSRLQQQYDAVTAHVEVLLVHYPANRLPDRFEQYFVRIQDLFERYLDCLRELTPQEMSIWLLSSMQDDASQLYSSHRALCNRLCSYPQVHRLPEASLDTILLNECNIVFSTVNVGARGMFKKAEEFEVVIIDEATQVVEAETAILFTPAVKKLVLAGDHKQLSATVTSTLGLKLHYGRSLFERLVECNQYPSLLLNTQYRMHPKIAEWSSHMFYGGKVLSADNVKSDKYTKVWHATVPPLCFFDAKGGAEGIDGTSIFNELEHSIVINLLQLIRREVVQHEPELTVGIITPYSAQSDRLTFRINKMHFGGTIKVTVKTVDGYQGQECDVSIVFVIIEHRTLIHCVCCRLSLSAL